MEYGHVPTHAYVHIWMRFNFTCLQSTAYYSMQAVLVTSFSVTLIFVVNLFVNCNVLKVADCGFNSIELLFKLFAFNNVEWPA